MKYYEIIKSLSELLEMWRLPKYLPSGYIMDDVRRTSMSKAINAIKNGENVLIIGKMGVGKTAFLFMLARELIKMDISCGVLIYNANIFRDHENEGIIILIDDIDEYGRNIIKAIIKMNIKNIVATLDIAKMREIEESMGIKLSQYFTIIYLPPMRKEDMLKGIELIKSTTEIEIPDEYTRILAEKSNGLPLYIAQGIQIFERLGIKEVKREHVEKLPPGIYKLAEHSLWNYIDKLPPHEKYAAILILLTIGDIPKNFLHEDIIYALYYIYCKELGNENISLEKIILYTDLEKKFPFLVRLKRYYFSVPHDVWLDVIRRSRRKDVIKLKSRYSKMARFIKLKNAINLARRKITPKIKDKKRLKLLEEQVKRILKITYPRRIQPSPPRIMIPYVPIDDKLLSQIERPPLERFLADIISISKDVLSESFRERLALILADFIKAKKLMIMPIQAKTEIINILLKAKLKNILNDQSKKVMLEWAKTSSIFAEELAILKYGYGVPIDISSIEDKISYNRLALRLLILGISAADIINMFFRKLNIDIIIELAIIAQYKERKDISEVARYLKTQDSREEIMLILEIISANDPQKIDKLWIEIERSVKLLFKKLRYQSLLANNLDRQIKVLREAMSFSCEEVIEFIEYLIVMNYYRNGFHSKDLLGYCLGLTKVYSNCENKIKLSILKKIADTQGILLAKKIISDTLTQETIIKDKYQLISRILGRMRDSDNLKKIMDILSGPKRYKALEYAIINSI